MKIIIAILRAIFGIFIGFIGCIALLNAPYHLANANFKFSNDGLIILASLIIGDLMIAAAWRLIRGPRRVTT